MFFYSLFALQENRKPPNASKPQKKAKIPTGPQLRPDELKERGMSAIAKAKMSHAKRERMTKIFETYLSGRTMPSI